jgi:DNA-binding NarL/FixJ family response regulator
MVSLPTSTRLRNEVPAGGRPDASPGLTPAEQAVLGLLLAGLANKEIAAALGKAEPTVKHQVSSILRKYHQPSRTRLLAVLR